MSSPGIVSTLSSVNINAGGNVWLQNINTSTTPWDTRRQSEDRITPETAYNFLQRESVIGYDSCTHQYVTCPLPYARRASYNTRQALDDDEPQGCMNGTRVQILADLEAWAMDDTGPTVCWMNGMAGTGKSSIAHSFSKSLDEKHMLGASFFCSRSASQELRDASLIIPTIAYRLAQASPLFRSEICQVIEDEPEAGSLLTLSQQFKLLLVNPVQKVFATSIKTFKIVIIDAIDECTKLGTVEKLIQSVVAFAPDIPLKFFISSRDTSTIRTAFNHNTSYPPKIVPLHEVEKNVVKGDIKTYLEMSLAAIARRGAGRLTLWPPPGEVETLLQRSDRLFIYAATAVRYIGVPDVDFRKRLTLITRLEPSKVQESIDSLYNEILGQAFHDDLEPDEVSSRRETLSAVVFLLVPLSMTSIASLLMRDNYGTRLDLAPFCSVIHVSTSDDNLVSIFHASFREFVVHPSRCEKHFLDASRGHQMLTVKCLRCLNRSLRRNISNLESDTTGSPPHGAKIISDGLRYSCLHWASHLAHALTCAVSHSVVIEVQGLLSTFVDEHLLHWFECLSALQELESGLLSLARATEAISACSTEDFGFKDIPLLLEDARRFLQLSFELIQLHPLNIYHSALVWIPETSPLRGRYDTLCGSTPHVRCGLSRTWGPVVHIMPHAQEVTSVAFSPDGSRIVSGSKDTIVRIWNTATGKLVGELEGHSRRVTSVAFSRRYIVSGSGDATVRLWNATKFQQEHVLEGHSRGVMSVALSFNDKYVLSGSDDMSVRMWDAETGLLVRELKGHSDMVKSVAFSPDCQHIASGSYSELCIWNIEGVIKHKHRDMGSSWVTSVAFSRNGRDVVTAGGMVRAWNVATGLMLDTALKNVGSVAFSRDGLHVVGGTRDGIVSVWDSSLLHESSSAYHLTGHLRDVMSVSFSHDNNRIVSGSSDRTVYVWNTTLSREAGVEKLPHGIVTSIAFSHDGGLVASASRNHYTRVWDMAKGKDYILNGDSMGMTSVTFLRDGSCIISGSYDWSLCIWETSTGNIKRTLQSHSQVTSVAVSHNNHIVSGSGIAVEIWDPDGEKLNMYLHSAEVSSVAFSRDDSRIVFGSNDKMVRIWNLETDKIEWELKGHSGTVTSVAFSHDGGHVVSGSSDGTVLIQNVTTNKSILLSERVQLPDGTRVHSLSNGQFHIYDPIDKGATKDIRPCLLSISPKRDWVVGDQTTRDCWIPLEYRDFSIASVSGSIVCLGYPSGRVVILDLKSPLQV